MKFFYNKSSALQFGITIWRFEGDWDICFSFWKYTFGVYSIGETP